MSAALDPTSTDIAARETDALIRAVEVARANRRGVAHEAMRDWLLELAAGRFDTPPPEAHDL